MSDELSEIRERMKREIVEAAERKEAAGAARRLMPSEPITVTDATLDAAVGRYPVVAVDLWAPWCGPCRVIGPILEELASEMQGRIVVAKLNVDENPQATARFEVQGIPTLLLFRGGRLVDRVVGALPKQALQARFERVAG